jgi:putative Mg2+ transporter-C (MgtC) family protein
MNPVAPNALEFSLRLLLAIALGAAIGVERQLRQHEAGLKTNALVAAGAAIFTGMSYQFPDPDRIIAQIVTGIGFLGAGIIMRDGLHVRGLNTAATLWCSAAIGAMAGAGKYDISAIAAAMVLIANIGLREIAEAIDKHHQRAEAEGRESGTKGQ